MAIEADIQPMAAQGWVLDGSTWHRDRCRIDPLGGIDGGWILGVVPWGSTSEITSRHRTLSGAMAWADHRTRLVTRKANRLRHGIASIACAFAAGVVIVLAMTDSGVPRVASFVVAVTCAFVALHEMAELLDGTVPEEGIDRPTRWWHIVDVAIERAAIRWAGSLAPEAPTPDESPVRVLDGPTGQGVESPTPVVPSPPTRT